ncbi:MAG: hypothetical protein ACO38W_12510 [Phycisphaerales bacterium]
MTEDPIREESSELDRREVSQIEATLASARRVRLVARGLRAAGAVVVALSLLAGLAMAVVGLTSGFDGCAPNASVPEPGAIRSEDP